MIEAQVSIIDGDGGEVARAGSLCVAEGKDPGTVEVWVGDDAGMIVDRSTLMAALGAVTPGAR